MLFFPGFKWLIGFESSMKSLFNITLCMSYKWENTQLIQEAVWNIVQCVMNDEKKSSSISMVSTELVENAVKYGDHDYVGEDAILFSLIGNNEEVIVEVKNKTKENGEHIRRMDETIQWIRGYQNPFEAYVERLKSVSKSKSGESILGMARIAYEGNGILDFFVDDNNRVSVSATIPL